MTAAPRIGALGKLLQGLFLKRRTCYCEREAEALREETGESTEEARRGRGPSTHAGITKLMSGRANSQQGLATTCKDPPYKETKSEEGFWSGA